MKDFIVPGRFTFECSRRHQASHEDRIIAWKSLKL
jgi:hypothetical protein